MKQNSLQGQGVIPCLGNKQYTLISQQQEDSIRRMLSLFECDITQPHSEEMMRQYMSCHLSIKTNRHIKMRTTIDNEMEFYCCPKCKDSLRIIFKPVQDKYILKEYVVNYSECTLKGEDLTLNYYLNLIDIYYPTIRSFIKNHQLEEMSANKVLKRYSEKVFNSKLTFLDLMENVSHSTKSKISKKWSNLITKYRREENFKGEAESSVSQSQISFQIQSIRSLQSAKDMAPNIHMHKVWTPPKVLNPSVEFKLPVASEQKEQKEQKQQQIVIYQPYEGNQEEEEGMDFEIDLAGFTSNWQPSQAQQPLRPREINIDESLPKHLSSKNNSLFMTDVMNPSFESVNFNRI